jgi:class 3 adenylate cyclase
VNQVRVIEAVVFAAMTAVRLPGGISLETGSYVFQRYSPDQYGASPENWAVAQDHRGVMYFGNTDALLEFDGQSWRTIRLSNGSFARAVAVDHAGTVYVGGVGIFGLLRPDSTGSMTFVSLLDKVPQADRRFSDIWRVLPTPQGVYFSAYERLFRLEPDGSLRVWRPSSNFGRAVTMQDALYVKTREKGLMKMEGDTLSPVRGGQVFQTLGVTAASSMDSGGLIATPSGFFRLDAEGVKPFPTAADAYFAANPLYTMYVFPDGEIAAGTRKGALVLLNRDGLLDRILTRASGLTDDYISAIFRDRQGSVWLAGNNGITYVNPGLTLVNANLGLQGNVKCVARAGGILYAGSEKGLFRMRTSARQEPGFEPIPGIDTAVTALLPLGDQILAATDSGVFAVSSGHASEVFKSSRQLAVYDISGSLSDPSAVYVAGRAGVFMLRRNGDSWKQTAEFAVPGQEFRSVREDPDGRVWTTTNEAIWRIDFRGQAVQSESFSESQGAPGGWKNPRLFQGHMVFSTQRGITRYSEAKRRFEPDTTFGREFADGSRDVFNIFEDPLGNVWVTGQRYHGVLLKQGGGYKRLDAPLLSSGIQEIYDMSFDEDGTAWAFGAKGVLYRWQRSLYGNPDESFQVLARRVGTIGDNGTIYGGAGAFQVARLPYRENALHFEFAAPFSEDPAAVEYQVMLEGSDRNWSTWGHETRKDYTHLPEGSYRFRVRARSPHGAFNENATLAFGVLPPWYRTWYAYGTYLALAGLGVSGIVRLRTRQLVAETRRLEHIVEERTVEIREQRDEIHRQERKGNSLLLNILPETVAEELKAHGSVKPVGFDDVTVCFTDFVGFTVSSEKLTPAALVDELNQYFTAFDEIVARYGLEKLKTIGDSYMFASGLPVRRSAHAVDAVMAALEMVDVAKSLAPRTGWGIRVGLNSGPVVAGVVGTRKFAFDIWGNTVNLASRMESSGVPGRVNLSDHTYSLTHGLIECEGRGPVLTKDGRELPMFLARGPASELLDGPLNNGIPAAFAARYEAEFGEKTRSFRAATIRWEDTGYSSNAAPAARIKTKL